MLRLDLGEHSLGGPEQIARLLTFLRDAFHHRRKTLRFNLGRILAEAQLAAAEERIDLTRRPETLSVEEWTDLAQRTVLPA